MTEAKIILSHSGKQHSYQVARSLQELGAIQRFYTSSYIKSKLLQNFILKSGNQYWNRRFINGVCGSLVNANWRFEIPEILLRLQQGKSPKVQEAVYARDVNFDTYVANRLMKEKGANIFWGFQGSCYNSLKSAVNAGMEAWCELATAHVSAAQIILGEEAKLQPKWAHTIDNLTFPAHYQKRLEEEPHHATKIIAASQFTKLSLNQVGIDDSKIVVLPLGCDINHISYHQREDDNVENRPLKLLYAGTITQRKGISYLLEATNQLSTEIKNKQIEIHLIGGIQGNIDILNQYKELIHYHPPISQQSLFSSYTNYDALILPTIFEGFGLVIVEAMAAGLPVITTSHSMGPDIIKNDINGYIIPIRDANAIKDRIIDLRNKTSGQYAQMRLNARVAAENYAWNNYTARLKNSLLG